MRMGLAPRTRILIADVPEVAERLGRVLAGHDLAFVHTAAEAMALLKKRGDFGMVIVGVHFDESHMFALLSDIRTHARYKKVPVVCVAGLKSRLLSDIALEGLDHAVRAMQANGFLVLSRFPDDEKGNARIRRIIDHLILINGDLHEVAAQH